LAGALLAVEEIRALIMERVAGDPLPRYVLFG
jgi:hypothetical protein